MKKEYDLRSLRKRPGKVRVYPSAAKMAVGLRLDGSDLARLKTEALRRGIRYQTLLGSILHQYLNGDLIERRSLTALPETRTK